MMPTAFVRGRLATRRGGPTSRGRLLALDLETTGLDAQAEILAVGDVPIVDGAVRLGEAGHVLVRPGRRSAVLGIEAHHLRPADVAAAARIEEVLPDLLARIGAADAIVVHHAALDVRVLRHACRAIGRRWPDPPVIDTVGMVEQVRRRQRHLGGPRMPRDLTGARASLDLPPHRSHDALADAIATAELYLALRARLRT
jgi:DNA polymerase III subunit epsilon